MTPPTGTPPTRSSPPDSAAAHGPAVEQPAARLRRARRERTLAVLGCLVGAAVVLFSASSTWVSARVQAAAAGAGEQAVAAPLPMDWSGGSLAPAATALALLGLAGTVAVIATRRVGRTLVGALVSLAGIAILLTAGGIALDPAGAVRGTDEVRAIVPAGEPVLLGLSRTAGPWLAAAGGLLLAVTGVFVAARAGAWPAMSGRYQARVAAPVDAWDAIERGQDPT